jgi:subtilisin family serine protease
MAKKAPKPSIPRRCSGRNPTPWVRSNPPKLALLALLVAVSCGAPPDEGAERVPQRIAQALGAGESIEVIVLTDERYHRGEMLRALPSRELQLLRHYERLPVVALTLHSTAALAALLQHPATVRVYENERLHPSLAASLPLIGAPAARDAGRLGAGTSVAVLDTAVDYTLPAFGSCTAPGLPAGCKVIVSEHFGGGAAGGESGHGTNVAAIVLGVAPGTQVIALDVFRSNGTAVSSDVLAAIDWVIANQATYQIAAMNLSLETGAYAAPCANNVFADALMRARAAGILTAVAAGNNGQTGKLSSPACAPAAISVGAVYSADFGRMQYPGCTDGQSGADRVTCFTNVAPFLTLFAPGALVNAGGYLMAGTSQAAPHVAGAIAVLRGAFPAESLDETVARLTRSPSLARDPRSGVEKPRLDLADAVGSGSSGGGGALSRNREVGLRPRAGLAGGSAKLCVGEGLACTTSQPLAHRPR